MKLDDEKQGGGTWREFLKTCKGLAVEGEGDKRIILFTEEGTNRHYIVTVADGEVLPLEGFHAWSKFYDLTGHWILLPKDAEAMFAEGMDEEHKEYFRALCEMPEPVIEVGDWICARSMQHFMNSVIGHVTERVDKLGNTTLSGWMVRLASGREDFIPDDEVVVLGGYSKSQERWLEERAMSREQERLTRKLAEIGAAWVLTPEKYLDPSDPLEDQETGRKTYHVHPDASNPHPADILRFGSLIELRAWANGESLEEA